MSVQNTVMRIDILQQILKAPESTGKSEFPFN